MAESVVSSAVEAIGNLLIGEAKFLWGVEGKVKDLQEELKLIKCLLRDADVKGEHDQSIGEWVTQLQDIAYDAEDVIERYILRVALKREQSIIKACACFMAKRTGMQVHVVGIEIEGLKSRISYLQRQMKNYGVQSVNESKHVHARTSTSEWTYAHFEEDFVGREDTLGLLVKELLNDGQKQRVTFILGMGGLGKTSLAKKVITHDKVKNNFDGFAWACVSQEYHVREILENILVKLEPDQKLRVMHMRHDELLETLYKIQQEKRCIVVLDDIWTKEAWVSLRAAFPVKNTISKLLITTRNREVAEYIDPQGLFHELQGLSDLESWDLLKKRAFPETKVITDDMKTLGDELLKKCGGLPLAIIVLGGLLVVNQWETVHKKIKLYFSDKSDVLQVLALSYDDLPWHLMPCFLYLGSFPEDAEIPTTKVLYMWIAEGFVSPDAYDEENIITAEDVAEQYLMELVKRGLVQVRVNLSGNIKTCRLHDLMRDLCVFKARQERFLSNLNIQQDDEREDSSSSMAIEVESTCKTRRLSLNMCVIGEGNTTSRVEQIGRTMLHLRTFMFVGSIKGEWKQFQPIFINCKFLRVLKLENLRYMALDLPKSMGDLVHLRFLSLAGSIFASLPKSMGNLVLMEFLDVCAQNLDGLTLPNMLWKMRRLRYLHLPFKFQVDDLKKLRLDTLKNLRTLRNFCPKKCDVNHVGKLTNLQKLIVTGISGSNKVEIIPELAKFTLKHLQSSYFKFRSDDLFTEGELSKMSSYPYSCKLSVWGKIEKLPEHKNLPQQLRKLVLVNSYLKEDPMPILEKMPHLVVLLLWDAFVGEEMVCSAGGFSQLKHLVLHELRQLGEWRVAEGAMPHLSRLGVWFCPLLRYQIRDLLPQGVQICDGYEDYQRDMRKMWSSML